MSEGGAPAGSWWTAKAIRHRVDFIGSWQIWCLPRYHVIEGAGLSLRTPLRRDMSALQRCATDPEAARFMGWSPDIVDRWNAPDPIRTRVDLRPQPWLGDYFMLSLRRMHSREIIGYNSVVMVDGVPDLGAAIRIDQRRSKLGTPAGIALVALLSQHFGFQSQTAWTMADNVAVEHGITIPSVGFVHAETAERSGPSGTVTMHRYERHDRHAVNACPWGMWAGHGS